MKSASTTCLRSIALITGVCCVSMALSAQTKSGADTTGAKRVRLVLRTDPQFDTLVRQRLPDVAASSRYQLMKATSVVVVNDTPFIVNAVTLKWFITQADGKENFVYSCICPEPAGRILLPGRRWALLPSHIALVSPLGHTEEGVVAGHAVNASLMDSAYAPSSSALEVLGAQKLVVKIDGIVFDNDVVVGTDTFGLLEKFECERNGAIEEAQSLRVLMDNPNALAQRLNSDAALRDDTTTYGACTMSRAREARRLLDVQESGGTSAVNAAIQRLANARAVSLRHAQ
jgi:hypothetical protein